MEDGLGGLKQGMFLTCIQCLNPCFSGGWSRSKSKRNNLTNIIEVLILVLVEDGLGVVREGNILSQSKVLILVLVEDGLGDQLNTLYYGKEN